jgi:hypothetical protein
VHWFKVGGLKSVEMAETTVDATKRLNVKKQTLDDAYAAPANFLEIDVVNPITHGVGKKRYSDYEVRMRVSLWPVSLYHMTLTVLVLTDQLARVQSQRIERAAQVQRLRVAQKRVGARQQGMYCCLR